MKKVFALTLASCVVFSALAACDTQTTPQPTPTAMPNPSTTLLQQRSVPVNATPCASVTSSSARVEGSSTAIVQPAGRTTAAANQPTLSPQELATKEAELEGKNRPGPILSAGTPNVSTLPLCPTPTVIK